MRRGVFRLQKIHGLKILKAAFLWSISQLSITPENKTEEAITVPGLSIAANRIIAFLPLVSWFKTRELNSSAVLSNSIFILSICGAIV